MKHYESCNFLLLLSLFLFCSLFFLWTFFFTKKREKRWLYFVRTNHTYEILGNHFFRRCSFFDEYFVVDEKLGLEVERKNYCGMVYTRKISNSLIIELHHFSLFTIFSPFINNISPLDEDYTFMSHCTLTFLVVGTTTL